MNTERLKHLSSIYRSGLIDDVIPFWIRHGIDHDHGGYFSILDQDGYLLDSNKAAWVQGRFAWILATLYNSIEKNPDWLRLAKHGLEFLERYGTDKEDNRMWFLLTQKGEPLEKSDNYFSESFACIANAAYFQATGEPVYAERASRLFRTFWEQCQNKLNVASPDCEIMQSERSFGSSMIAIHAAQVCREAEIAGNWDAIIDTCITDIQDHFVHPDIECVMETVALDGSRLNHLKGRTLNPGHAIEAAWFILEEARYRMKDKALCHLGTQMLKWMWDRGWDAE